MLIPTDDKQVLESRSALPAQAQSALAPPPAYSPSATSVPSPPGLPPLAAQNHLRMERHHHKIDETLLIDPSLPGEGTNLVLNSHHSSVTARVYLVGELRENKKVEMVIEAHHGPIKFDMCHRDPALPVRLSFASRHGTVSVGLPSDFRGPMKITTRHGSIKILPSLAARLRTLNEVGGVRMCWVGEGGQYDEGVWDKDECEIKTRHGNVVLGFLEDRPAEVAQQGGFKGLFKIFKDM